MSEETPIGLSQLDPSSPGPTVDKLNYIHRGLNQLFVLSTHKQS